MIRLRSRKDDTIHIVARASAMASSVINSASVSPRRVRKSLTRRNSRVTIFFLHVPKMCLTDIVNRHIHFVSAFSVCLFDRYSLTHDGRLEPAVVVSQVKQEQLSVRDVVADFGQVIVYQGPGPSVGVASRFGSAKVPLERVHIRARVRKRRHLRRLVVVVHS